MAETQNRRRCRGARRNHCRRAGTRSEAASRCPSGCRGGDRDGVGRTSKLVFQIGKRRSGDQAFDIREYVDRPPRGDNPGYSGPTRSGFRLHEENYEEFLEAVKAVGRKLGCSRLESLPGR